MMHYETFLVRWSWSETCRMAHFQGVEGGEKMLPAHWELVCPYIGSSSPLRDHVGMTVECGYCRGLCMIGSNNDCAFLADQKLILPCSSSSKFQNLALLSTVTADVHGRQRIPYPVDIHRLASLGWESWSRVLAGEHEAFGLHTSFAQARVTPAPVGSERRRSSSLEPQR